VYLAGKPCALAAMKDSLVIYDLSAPSTPRLLGALSIPGVRGVTTLEGKVVAFGREGFVQIVGTDAATLSTAAAAGPSVLDAVVGRGVLYAAEHESLRAYSPALRPGAAVELVGSTCLALVANTLVAGGPSGIELFDVSDPQRPRRRNGKLALNTQRLVVPPDMGGRAVLAVSSEGQAWLINLLSEEPSLLVTYPRPPWFASSGRLPGLLVRIGADRRSIVVSALGPSFQTGGAPPA
jgi:hypothetical protein